METVQVTPENRSLLVNMLQIVGRMALYLSVAYGAWNLIPLTPQERSMICGGTVYASPSHESSE